MSIEQEAGLQIFLWGLHLDNTLNESLNKAPDRKKSQTAVCMQLLGYEKESICEIRFHLEIS